MIQYRDDLENVWPKISDGEENTDTDECIYGTPHKLSETGLVCAITVKQRKH